MTAGRAMGTVRTKGIRSIGLCLLACWGLGGCAESGESPEVLVERGHLSEGRGQFQQAIDAYTKAVAQRPNEASIYYDRGVAYGRLGEWKESAEDYSRAIELSPGMARAFNNRASAYAQQHQFEAAIKDFKKAIQLDPHSALTYRNLGLAYHDSQQLDKAIENLSLAIDMDAAAFDGPFERGNAYLEARQYQKAADDFTRAINIDASRATAFLNRGEAYRNLGDLKRAQADVEKARQLDPDLVRTALAQSPPPPQVLPVSAEEQVATSDSDAHRAQALSVATEFLKSKGFQVESGPAPSPFDLACFKGSRKLLVEVQAPAEGQTNLRFTSKQITAAEQATQPIALVVVEKGKVGQFNENWKPVKQKLIPWLYEYPRE